MRNYFHKIFLRAGVRCAGNYKKLLLVEIRVNLFISDWVFESSVNLGYTNVSFMINGPLKNTTLSCSVSSFFQL